MHTHAIAHKYKLTYTYLGEIPVVRKDGAYLKTQRLGQIRQMVAQFGPLDREGLISLIEVKIGLRTSTAESYLELLVRSREIAYDEKEDVYETVMRNE